MKWVLASERLPEMETTYFLKVYGKPGFGKWYSDKKVFALEATDGWGPFDNVHFEQIEWLDEFPASLENKK